MVVNQTSFREVNVQINWNKTEETLCLRSKEQPLKTITMQLDSLMEERKNTTPCTLKPAVQMSVYVF